MAVDILSARVSGIQAMKSALLALPAKLRKRVLRNALGAGGRVFRDDARSLTPLLSVPVARKGRTVRQAGTVRKAIGVRTSKLARRAGDVGVYVNVRPAKGADRGATSPRDPFYWRFLEFGTRKMHAFRMLQKAAGRKTQEALRRIETVLSDGLAKIAGRGEA